MDELLTLKHNTMKIELIKKTYLDGYVQYYISRDGEMVSGTATDSEEKANLMYENAVKSGKAENKVETIKSTEL